MLAMKVARSVLGGVSNNLSSVLGYVSNLFFDFQQSLCPILEMGIITSMEIEGQMKKILVATIGPVW